MQIADEAKFKRVLALAAIIVLLLGLVSGWMVGSCQPEPVAAQKAARADCVTIYLKGSS